MSRVNSLSDFESTWNTDPTFKVLVRLLDLYYCSFSKRKSDFWSSRHCVYKYRLPYSWVYNHILMTMLARYHYNNIKHLLTILNWRSLGGQQNHCQNVCLRFDVVSRWRASYLPHQHPHDAFFFSHISSTIPVSNKLSLPIKQLLFSTTSITDSNRVWSQLVTSLRTSLPCHCHSQHVSTWDQLHFTSTDKYQQTVVLSKANIKSESNLTQGYKNLLT